MIWEILPFVRSLPMRRILSSILFILNIHIVRLLHRLKDIVFPSEYELELRRWRADGGSKELRFNYDLYEESLVVDLAGFECHG